MVKGNGTSRPYLHMIGGSSTDVTGSMHHLRFKKYSLLLDCGMIQGGDIVSVYQANKNQIKSIKANEIDYIILSHVHIDHSGLIPALFAKGCNAHVYVPKGSIDFLKLLWDDSLKILTSDCQKIEAKHGRKASSYYSANDISKALMRCIEVDFNKPYKINDCISFTYYPAGHIINSAQVMIELKEGNITKRVGYTGDIGGDTSRPYVDNKQTLPFVDILIGENTYNSPARPNSIKDRPKDEEKLVSIINEYSKILIPTFSLGRTQEILTVLYNLWNRNKLAWPLSVYLDSPLASKINAIWPDSFEWDRVSHWTNLKVIDSWESSVLLQESNAHCVVISASGFLQGGRIMNHLKTALPHSNNHLIFVGYAGDNNLASQIKSGQKEVMIDGVLVPNNANITELRSFSSHASYEELIDYYANQCRYNKIALVHGNYEDKVEFAHTLQNELISQGKSARVICTQENQKIYI